jgi:uncharacterized iron-regulated membrane protein
MKRVFTMLGRLTLHRWAALVSMVFIVIAALSGSALVFEGGIDRAMYPALWRVTAGERIVTLDSAVASAEHAVPRAPVTGVSFSPGGPIVVQAGGTQVFVDPFSGVVKGTRTAAEASRTLARQVHVQHTALLAGKTGSAIVAIATLVALLLILSGLLLWWPDKLWRVRWSASWKRIAFDVHHAAGVIAAVVLVVITSTGLVTHYQALSRALAALDRTETPPPPAQPAAAPGTVPVSLASVYAAASRALPGARVTFISLPAPRPSRLAARVLGGLSARPAAVQPMVLSTASVASCTRRWVRASNCFASSSSPAPRDLSSNDDTLIRTL